MKNLGGRGEGKSMESIYLSHFDSIMVAMTTSTTTMMMMSTMVGVDGIFTAVFVWSHLETDGNSFTF